MLVRRPPAFQYPRCPEGTPAEHLEINKTSRRPAKLIRPSRIDSRPTIRCDKTALTSKHRSDPRQRVEGRQRAHGGPLHDDVPGIAREGRARGRRLGRARDKPGGNCRVVVSALRPGAVHALGRTVSGPDHAVSGAGQPVDDMPDAAIRGHPTATRVGHRRPPLVQQPPQADTTVCAPAVLNMYAARMARFVGHDHPAAASSTHDTSSRIHQLTVGVDHRRRDRSRTDA